MTPVLLVLIPLGALALVAHVVLTAADHAHEAVSRSALVKALSVRPEAVRARVLAQHTDGARTRAAVALGRVLADAVLVASVAGVVFMTLDGWVLPTLVTVVITAALLFVVLAISPRSLGRRRPEHVLISTRTPVQLARVLLWLPVLALTRLAAGTVAPSHPPDSAEEGASQARQNVDRALEDEHVHDGERDMIQGVLDLRETMVRELMVPRTDMVAITADAPAEKAMRLFVRSGFSRVPVIGESVDDLCGMLYAKDAMRAIHSPWDPRPQQPVHEIMRPARFVPEFVAADQVMRRMQTEHIHICVVVDEYGGVAGIATIEDILEEIVGEIADEHDPSAPEIEDLGEGTYRAPARSGVSDVAELFDLDIDDEDVDSVGGLLGKALGRVPIVGSRGDIHGLHLEAERTAGRRKRLASILVTRSAPAEDDHRSTDQEDDHE